MNKDERLLFLSTAGNDPKFDALYTESIKKEKEQKQKKSLVKFLVFFSLLLFYAIVFFTKGYWQYFFGYPEIDRTMNGNPLDFLIAFFVGAIFIWLPMDTLDRIGSIKFTAEGSGGIAEKSPAEALRFFGWIIFIIPMVIFVFSYLKN